MVMVLILVRLIHIWKDHHASFVLRSSSSLFSLQYQLSYLDLNSAIVLSQIAIVLIIVVKLFELVIH